MHGICYKPPHLQAVHRVVFRAVSLVPLVPSPHKLRGVGALAHSNLKRLNKAGRHVGLVSTTYAHTCDRDKK